VLSDKRRAEAMLIGITVIWGLTFALVKKSLDEVQPFVFMAWRFWVAALIMGALSIPRLRHIDRRILRDGLLLGILLYASYSFQTFGLEHTTAGNAGFITGLFIVFTPILAAIFLGHRPDPKSIAAVVVALIGLGVLSLQPGLEVNYGDALVLACAFTYSVHIVLLDGYAKKYDLLLLTFVQMLLLAVAFTVSGFLFEEMVVPKTGFVWMSILVCGILASAAAFYVQGYAQRILTPVRTSMVLIMEPVFSVLFGILILGEHLTWRGWLGCVLIFAGMLMTEIPVPLARRGREANGTEPGLEAQPGGGTQDSSRGGDRGGKSG
jgi:drug/metabolite transporter (DMT)-like permease